MNVHHSEKLILYQQSNGPCSTFYELIPHLLLKAGDPGLRVEFDSNISCASVGLECQFLGGHLQCITLLLQLWRARTGHEGHGEGDRDCTSIDHRNLLDNLLAYSEGTEINHLLCWIG